MPAAASARTVALESDSQSARDYGLGMRRHQSLLGDLADRPSQFTSEYEADMSTFRIALANLSIPATPLESVQSAIVAIADAGRQGASVICFSECFVPGYRWPDSTLPAPDAEFLGRALVEVGDAAKAASITVILGTERVTTQGLQITACVFNPDGAIAGWQDKVQLDPPEEAIYPGVGTERRVFTAGALTFGVVICHEGWRYPETVRAAARRGAQVVFHPHAHIAEPGSYRPSTFADPANSFHEKAILCRAAENTCYVASVNCASEGSGTTSAIARPDGSLLSYQPYGQAGLLVADLDLEAATGFLAARLRTPG
ncbi:MAG: putative amidohydrolase [Planctomycetota bacterium]